MSSQVKACSLDDVKAMLARLNDKIESAIDREIEARQQKGDSDTKIEASEEERESCRRRMVLLQINLEKTNAALDEKEKKLEAYENRIQEDDERRRELEEFEHVHDDEMFSVEEEVGVAKQLAEEASLVVTESARKLTVLEGDLEKLHTRIDQVEAKEKEYIDIIESNSNELRDLEGRDDDAAEREMEAEEKMNFLQEQLKEETKRYEDAERDVVRNETTVAEIVADLDNVKKQHDAIGNEMGEIDAMVKMTLGDDD